MLCQRIANHSGQCRMTNQRPIDDHDRPPLFFPYWAKTYGDEYHLLIYHALDVAAVGSEYLKHHPRLRRFLARALGVPENHVAQWIGFFIALHDVGKFSESFQSQQPTLFQQLQSRQGRSNYATRHDILGYWAWRQWLAPLLSREDWFGLGAHFRHYRPLMPWIGAVTGHHGQPPKENAQNQLTLLNCFPEVDQQALIAFARAVRGLFWRDAPPPVAPTLDSETLKQTSWWLAGLTVLADWLGSNRNYFAFNRNPMPLADYWQHAQTVAHRALHESGALPPVSASVTAFSTLFPKLDRPTPLQ
ncbi:MAG: CRISPR-associated endonuclease Cas3'' [Gammaproteobacteria bacterium]|jgi:CRISPR-associated endonuclease/helicase Cas3|nr:CRISPR-associated endonuclease Cas3'' [Gammaproteobacteria bacterium]